MKTWDRRSLADLCGKGVYGLVASAVDKPVGPKFLRTTDMITGSIDWGTVPYCEVGQSKATKFSVEHGDLVISRTGANAGAAAYVKDPPSGTVFAGYLVRFRALPGLADSRFLGFVLQSALWGEYVQHARTGSAQPQLNAVLMAKFDFECPSLNEQRRIAGVLGALDDLIDTNERLAESCASLRLALTESALETAESSLPLSSLASFVNGRNFTKDATGAGRPVIRTPEVRVGPTASTVRSTVEASDEFVASRGDILFVWSGSLLLGRWLFEKGLVNQHIFKVTPNPGVPDWLVYGLIEHQLPWFLGLAADKATTMGHIQRRHLDEHVPVPDAETVQALDRVIQPLWKAEIELAEESQQLRRTRDELLPLLMSGKVRVAPAVTGSLDGLRPAVVEEGAA